MTTLMHLPIRPTVGPDRMFMNEDDRAKTAHDRKPDRPHLGRRLVEAAAKSAVTTLVKHLVSRWLDENPDAIEGIGDIVRLLLSLIG